MSLSLPSILVGKTQDHLVTWEGRFMLHRDVALPFERLRENAETEGIDLRVASGFRSFDA